MFGKRKISKEKKELVAFAHKVLAYRRDLIDIKIIQDIENAAAEYESAPDEASDQAIAKSKKKKLEDLLNKHGGKIYKGRKIAENVEMVIVAAVLAIGVRTYFIQPFKIPTNSMWPTYAGLNATVYPPSESRPGIPERAFLGATQGLPQSLWGGFNYYITAPSNGELVIPVQLMNQGPLGIVPRTYKEDRQVLGYRIFGRQYTKIPRVKRDYTVLVGGTKVSFDTPADFELDDVVVKSWFPEFDDPNKGLPAVYEAYQAMGKVESTENPAIKLIRTGIQLSTGDTVLDFNINSGDMLFVDRFSYNFVRPNVGAPFVFRTENIPGLRQNNAIGQWIPDERYYIKRLVGEPGDTLEVKGSTLYSNGKAIEGADAFNRNAEIAEGYAGYKAWLYLAPGESETIPEGYFYAMGDNSPHSSDSRFWGWPGSIDPRTPAEVEGEVPINMVPEDDVVGRALFIFYPFSHRWGPAE